MEKLIIQGFAGLQDIEIIPKKINLLIGPQASGKSIIAKLLFYFRSFVQEIFLAGFNMESKPEFDRRLKSLFEQYFPLGSWGESEFTIQYLLSSEFISITRNKNSKRKASRLDLAYSDFYKKALPQARLIVKEVEESPSLWKVIKESGLGVYPQAQIEFLKRTSKKLSTESVFDQLFIPAGRSLFTIYDNNIFGFLSKDLTIDPLLIQFGRYYEQARNFSIRSSHEFEDRDIDALFLEFTYLKSRILAGEYIRHQGKDYIDSSDGRAVQLSHSSSGQQETLPLILTLENLLFSPVFSHSSTASVGYSTYIEEPEAHLFPSAQRDIVNLIATTYNAKFNQFRFFLTTHSPYILTSFNNLIQAGILSKNGHHDQVLNVMPSSQILDPDDVAAYHVVYGKARNIIDPETQLIGAQIIDSISEELAIQFDQLLDIS
jgi:hypothetical protein